MTVYPPVSVFLGDCGECQLELDGGELAEGSLASPAVVGVLDPHEDRAGELGSRGPALAVQDVLLEQRVEGLHGGVVAGRGGPAHRPGEVVRLEHRHEGPRLWYGWLSRTAIRLWPPGGRDEDTVATTESGQVRQPTQRHDARTPNPASIEAQTPDVGPERGSAVTGGGRR